MYYCYYYRLLIIIRIPVYTTIVNARVVTHHVTNHVKPRRSGNGTSLLYHQPVECAEGDGWWIFSACLSSPRTLQSKHPDTV